MKPLLIKLGDKGNKDKMIKMKVCNIHTLIMFSILGLFIMSGPIGCVPSGQSMKGDVDKYKPIQASPIDGTWINPWNDRVIIDRGRVYYPDFDPPMTILKNLKRVAPGKYRAENTGSFQIQGGNITLSLVAANKLVIITDVTEVAYSLVKVRNHKWHMDDFNKALEVAASEKMQKEPLVVHQATTTPGKVARGGAVFVNTIFTAFDPNKPTKKPVPVEYYYEIQKQGRAVYKSPSKTIFASNNEKTPLEIQLKAASREGNYEIILHISMNESKVQAGADFSIVSAQEAEAAQDLGSHEKGSTKGSIEDRLVGKWKFVMAGSTYKPSILTISKNGDQLAGLLKNPGSKTHWVKLRLEKDTLILEFKDSTSAKGCWYEGRDIITLNDKLDHMSVRSKIINGSGCVAIGQVFKSTMVRIE